MFLFGKKSKENKTAQKQEITKDDYERILNSMEEKQMLLENGNTEDRVQLLNELGSGYMEIGENDKALFYYEIALSESKEIGKAYTDLMKIYNIKRRAATEEKDDEKIKLYMDKIEELMKLSKDVIRGRA